MQPLSIGLIHRDHPRHAEHRMIGMWSYDVPEFEVTHIPQNKYFTLDKDEYTGRFDLLFWEDARTHGTVVGNAPIPLVYYVGDSTLSFNNFRHRYIQSRLADLVLVDWDGLSHFDDMRTPVARLSYCTNDRLFGPREKTVDVGFHAGTTEGRTELHDWLTAFCAQRGYSYAGGRRSAYEYCEAIGQARVNVNLNRNPYTRAHRCYDVMASRSCLLTSPMPPVSGETWRAGTHYLEWRDYDELGAQLDTALAGRWQVIADHAFEYSRDHIWSARAGQLHRLLTEFLEGWRDAIHRSEVQTLTAH